MGSETDGEPQNYLVAPHQPWLDGFCVSKGLVRQFVAMPLGDGYTAEEQLSGTGEHGGLQLAVQPLKAERYERISRAGSPFAVACPDTQRPMGLAPGGLMRQQIYEDEYGLDAWEPSARSRCFVHILNSVDFLRGTGAEPPTEPPTARAYSDAGMPWFEYYAADRQALASARKLAGLDSVASARLKQSAGILAGNEPIGTPHVIHLGSRSGVREGQF